MDIRRIRRHELGAAHDFVQAVVNETYAFIWHGAAPPISETDWSPAWVANDGKNIIALMLSAGEWIDDLWIAAPYRAQGLGTALLKLGETEIHDRGFAMARLRVVAGNNAAAEFYKRRGWSPVRQYSHEKLPIEMIDFEKALPRG